MSIFGNRLKRLRTQNNLTQGELGAKFNKSKNNISQYERGARQADDDFKIQLAAFFDVSMDFLLGLTDDPSPTPTVDYSVSEVKRKLKAEGIDMEDLNDEDIIEMLAKIIKMKKK